MASGNLTTEPMGKRITSGFLRRGLLALALLVPGAALAAESSPVTSPRVTATLLSSRDTVAPGERFQVALVQKIAKGWHTYWANPGDSGEPTRIDWDLPSGFSAGEIQWPAPKALPVAPLLNFGFEGEVLLPVEIAVPADAKPGDRLSLKANATWLVCEKICIPEEGAFALDLTVGQGAVADDAAQARIEAARAALPQPAGFKASLKAQGDGLALSLPGLAGASDLRFFPLSDTLIEHAADQPATGGTEGAVLQLTRSGAFKIESTELAGVVTYREAGMPRALSLVAAVDPALVTQATAAPASSGPAVVRVPAPLESDLTLWAALAFAFAGGLILNLMPCVLPVLFIKALGFAQAAQASRSEVREQGLLFLCGVLSTFIILAAAVIGLAALGTSVGWGFQLQSPPLVIALAVVMALIGLNLLGAFEIGGSVQGVGHGLASGGGRMGAFMTGVLAVVVATPCTAPFMGAAMGYAVTQPPQTALAVFLALALGFAAPVVALSFAPGWLRLLPKPGRWMVVLKQAFAFPMFATAIWLVWVASVQVGPGGVLAALAAILAAGFIVWLLRIGRGAQLRGRVVTAALALLVAGGAGAFVLQSAVPNTAAQAEAGDRQAWSPARVAALQAEGRPVFVNFTAAWCITCLANERVALSRQEVKDAFASLNVASLKADWTNRDATIAAALAEHGRAGVPLYLFYPAAKGGQAEILPQLLTTDMLIEAATRASGREAKTAANRP